MPVKKLDSFLGCSWESTSIKDTHLKLKAREEINKDLDRILQDPSRKSKLKLGSVPLVVCRSPFEVTDKNYFSRIYDYCSNLVKRYLI